MRASTDTAKGWALFLHGKLHRFEIQKTRKAMRISATGGDDDMRWWKGCVRNGYSIKRVTIKW